MADPWRLAAPLRYAGRDGPRHVLVDAAGGPERAIVTVVEEGVVRVQWQPLGYARMGRTWAVVGSAGDAPPEGREREDLRVFACPEHEAEVGPEGLSLRAAGWSLAIGLSPFALTWRLANGSLLAADHPERAYRRAEGRERGVQHVLRRDAAEVFLGLGEASGALDRHHRRFRLRPTDAIGYDAGSSDPLYKHLPLSITLTPAGDAVGFIYDTGAEATFDFGSEVDGYLGPYRSVALASTELDYYVLVGPALPRVVELVGVLCGRPPLPPRWSLGYLGSTMRYTDAEDPRAELAGFADRLREHDLPCGGFHLSSGYSLADDGRRYVFVWNERRVPDPRAMIAPLADAGLRTLANVKPALLLTHPDHAELAAAGAFVRRAAGEGEAPYLGRFWGGDGSFLDFTRPETYEWWRARVRERILDAGIDATWNDNNEFGIDDDGARCAAGEAGDLRPALTLLMNHASRAAQRDAYPERRDYQVTRSGSLGTHRYAQTWSGDNVTSWRTLAYNLPMGLSMSLCGWANHGHDVGGFAGPAPDPELLVRWIEASVTQPRFTIHSWNDDGSATEPWAYSEALPLVRRLLALRTALVPHLATLMHDAALGGAPLTRPLAYAFQGWRPGWRESFVHMLGEALLVAPVLEPGARERRVLLPPGRWLELASGHVWPGEREAVLDAPLGRPPLMLREGHALPLASLDMHALRDSTSWLAGGPGVAPPPIRWLCFPDASGEVRGSLVWEDGVSREYERGAIDRLELEGGQTDGRFAPRLRVLEAGSGCPLGHHEALVPGGGARLPWFDAGWTSVPVPGAD